MFSRNCATVFSSAVFSNLKSVLSGIIPLQSNSLNPGQSGLVCHGSKLFAFFFFFTKLL